MKQNPASYRFLTSPVDEEEAEGEVGFRPLKVIGRPIDKGSVNTTQGQRWSVLEVGENLGQERIIESHTVGPEVQEIQTTVEALFPVEHTGVAPGVSAGLAPQHHRCCYWHFNASLESEIIEIIEINASLEVSHLQTLLLFLLPLYK